MKAELYIDWKNKNGDDEDPLRYMPERALWFAVIERALKDYCFFFDRLCHTGQGHLISYESKSPSFANDFTLKAIGEYNRLRWFIYEKSPKPFNLQYLTEQLYEDGESAVSSIRKQVTKQFTLNLAEAEDLQRFVAVTSYVRKNTNLPLEVTDHTEMPLRHKRFRV